MRRGHLISAVSCLLPALSVIGCRPSEPSPESPAAATMPAADLPEARWIEMEGAHNFRDMGGYRTADGQQTRWHVLYRSSELAKLTADDCDAFARLGIGTVIDLRNRLSPAPLFGGDVQCVHDCAEVIGLPMLIVKDDHDVARYALTVQAYQEQFRRVFDMLADAERYPMLIHCAAGKDRTGIVMALLLSMLGVDRETVMEEYELSARFYDDLPVQRMAYLLAEVERAGGIEGYLESLGITAQTQQRIQENLLE